MLRADVSQVRQLHPELEVLNQLGADSRFIVSEPLREAPRRLDRGPGRLTGLVRRDSERPAAQGVGSATAPCPGSIRAVLAAPAVRLISGPTDMAADQLAADMEQAETAPEAVYRAPSIPQQAARPSGTAETTTRPGS